MAWLACGTCDAGQQGRGLTGRQGQDDLIAWTQLDPALPEVEPAGAVLLQADGAQPLPEAQLPRRAARGTAGPDRPGSPRGSSRAISGRQPAAPWAKLSHSAAQSSLAEPASGGVLSTAVASGAQKRRHSAIVRAQAVGDGLLPVGAPQPPGGEIGAKARARHAARPHQHPIRQRAGVGPHHPALAGLKIEKRKARVRRADQAVRRADRIEIGERAAIAAHQQMVAVVDHPAERAIEERPAAAAGLIGRLVQRDPAAPPHEPDRGGEPGEPSPDHVDDGHRAQSSP